MVARTRASLSGATPASRASSGARISDVLRATKSGLNRDAKRAVSQNNANCKPARRPPAAAAAVVTGTDEPVTAAASAAAVQVADRAVKREIEAVPTSVAAIAASPTATQGRPAKRARTIKPESSDATPAIQHPVPPALHPDILDDALRHLSAVDPRFGPLSRRFICRPWTPAGMAVKPNHFRSLALGIMSQQVSGAAARSISRKFVGLFHTPTDADADADAGAAVAVNGAAGAKVKREVVYDVDIDPEVEDGPEARPRPSTAVSAAAAAAATGSAPAMDATAATTSTGTGTGTGTGDTAPREEFAIFPSPASVAAADVLYLKSAGLSLRKAEYVQCLARAFVSGFLSDFFFAQATDAEIVARLTSLRGLGPWSAEMFLMFSLHRVDVLSYGDIGIQRGMSYWLGRDARDKSTHVSKGGGGKFKFVTQRQMDALADTWRPYRSIGCWFMWRVDGVIEHLHPPNETENGELEGQEAEAEVKMEPDIDIEREHAVKQEEV